MLINIADDLIRLDRAQLLDKLLVDKTMSNRPDGNGRKMERHILWATDAYLKWEDPSEPSRGNYGPSMEIKRGLLAPDHFRVVQTRARKAFEEQSERTKKHAEVFTPLFICKKMIDVADETWTEEILSKKWKKYVDARRLEITCGEAPFLVSRYDAATGDVIPVEERTGILDRKLSVITRFAVDEKEWVRESFRALQATYGYEFQGDNLVIARVNVFADWSEWLQHVWHREPALKEKKQALNIIAWNLWQMDGLTGKIPNTAKFMEIEEGNLFETKDDKEENLPDCRIYDWRNIVKSLEYKKLAERGPGIMKFDFVIGNPPYQEETKVNNRKSAIYHYFYDEAQKVTDKYILISPARFLFNTGLTPKDWNLKMLNDPHLKVMYYEPISSKVFPNKVIKGGVVIIYRDAKINFGAIEKFIPDENLRMLGRHFKDDLEHNFSSIVYSGRSDLKFNDKFLQKYPQSIHDRLEAIQGKHPNVKELSPNEEYELKSSTFETLPYIFADYQPKDSQNYYELIGLENHKRVNKWIEKQYMEPRYPDHNNISFYKVLLPESNGAGRYGETLSDPIVVGPNVSSTTTFISIGCFNKAMDAENVLKYIKTKFVRALLGIKKKTQHNPKSSWTYVPLQDFTLNSDIDWTQSISNIDKQLYKKYGLDEKEISFIESHVKEMA